MIDWLNCMLEFVFFFFIYSSVCGTISNRFRDYLIYTIFAGCASIYFTFSPIQILPLNMSIYIIVILVSFRQISLRERFFYAICSIAFMLAGEFTFLSFIPAPFLQGDYGNLIVNLLLVAITLFLWLFIRKKGLSSWVSGFFHKYLIQVLVFLICLIVLGQVYLLRLSIVWSYLPGIISLSLLSFFFFTVMLMIRHQMSTDKLRADTLEKQSQDSEAFVLALRTQVHDYKYHIQHLLDQIQTAKDLHSLQEETALYIANLEEDRSLYDRLIAIHHPVFRAAIYGCYVRCKDLKIPFQLITTEMLPSFPISDYKLVEVIDNLIANAIEHNLSICPERRFLSITMTVDNHIHLFAIENSVENLAVPLNELYLPGKTTKQEDHQGLGLNSIRQTLTENHISFSGSHNMKAGCVRFEIRYED